MKWTQEDITKWAEKQFGFNGPLPIAIRGNKEMSELLSSLMNSGTMDDAYRSAMECADVAIFLFQTSERLGFDLLEMVDKKMDINEKREWGKAADGSYQHVEKVPENLNGHTPTFGKMHVCSVCESSDFSRPCPGF